MFPGVDFEAIVGAADLVVHSGSGTAAQALLAGVPVLTMPSNLEQYVHAKRVEALGAGVTIGTGRTRADLDAALTRMISERSYERSAEKSASRHAGFTTASVAEHAARLIERAMQPSAAPLH